MAFTHMRRAVCQRNNRHYNLRPHYHDRLIRESAYINNSLEVCCTRSRTHIDSVVLVGFIILFYLLYSRLRCVNLIFKRINGYGQLSYFTKS